MYGACFEFSFTVLYVCCLFNHFCCLFVFIIWRLCAGCRIELGCWLFGCLVGVLLCLFIICRGYVGCVNLLLFLMLLLVIWFIGIDWIVLPGFYVRLWGLIIYYLTWLLTCWLPILFFVVLLKLRLFVWDWFCVCIVLLYL